VSATTGASRDNGDVRTSPPVSATGLVLAWLGYLVSLTPTMVPRTTAVQVVMSTLLPLTGYALGAGVGALARRLTGDRGLLDHNVVLRRVAIVALVLAGGAAVALTPAALQWQTDLASAAGWGLPTWPIVVVVAPLLTVLLVLVGRALRLTSRVLGEMWQRWVSWPPASSALGAATLGLLLVGVLAALLALLYRAYVAQDADTTGQQQPQSQLRSGGPESLVPWETLGRQGRDFVADGPSASDIEGFSGEQALEPIRTYVGMRQAETPEARAELLVEEVRRAGGFERSAVVVVVTSGLGSVHPVSARTLEYVANGDVALAATQYSAVPSWFTGLLDPSGAVDEASALVAAFSQAVSEIPEPDRPELYLNGESLGAVGSQDVFVGQSPQQVVESFDGVLWVGTPATSTLLDEWASFPDGTPPWEPVVGDGSVARFAASGPRVDVDDSTWGPRRILFLHSATDPVAYLEGSLWRTRPGWIGQSRYDTVPERMAWWPLFTWEQMLIDFTTNGIVPPGFGHNYSDSHATGWAAVLNRDGWDEATVARLAAYRALVDPPDPGLPVRASTG
jgi:uncharacterized membrane protein